MAVMNPEYGWVFHSEVDSVTGSLLRGPGQQDLALAASGIST